MIDLDPTTEDGGRNYFENSWTVMRSFVNPDIKLVLHRNVCAKDKPFHAHGILNH